MERRMTEEELISGFEQALERGDIYACYQPQVNHGSGRLVGAEALMRWRDPEYGLQYPSDFIPVLERSGQIYQADLHIFELVCRMHRKCLDEDQPIVPVSINMSRYDIYNNNYVEEIERIRKKYNIPVRYLRVELTESSAIGGMELVLRVLRQLHLHGYIVEMDDFGSGYSSLNVLKDLDVDIIKLDMRFLSGGIGGRGGTILNSIMQMTRWLGTPVIAEGVEDLEKADYMKSIGCNYIQGYLYSKPIQESDYLSMLKTSEHEAVVPAMKMLPTMNANRFWDPESLETLIFSNFVGGAAIFSYAEGKIEMLRVNEKYVKELGMNLTEKEILRSEPWSSCDNENRRIYEKALQRAIETDDEVSCETWRKMCSRSCGEDKVCIRSDIRMVGKSSDQYIFYVMIRNVTAEKKRFEEVYNSDNIFRHSSEQTNTYAWEYNITTKEMRPCFRCMRDLGLPPLVKNYPEPAIEAGIFPQDYADMYRDWHKQLSEGVEHLEAVIPLTVGRVPFLVKYTAEFDENGKPYKAYGSATYIPEQNPVL